MDHLRPFQRSASVLTCGLAEEHGGPYPQGGGERSSSPTAVHRLAEVHQTLLSQ